MFAIDDSWRYLSDDDLRRWLAFYRRRLALFDEETPPGEFNEDTRAATSACRSACRATARDSMTSSSPT
jgi:hypothetical protein